MVERRRGWGVGGRDTGAQVGRALLHVGHCSVGHVSTFGKSVCVFFFFFFFLFFDMSRVKLAPMYMFACMMVFT